MSAAVAGPLEGDWQQASSNAGHCDNCAISVAALGDHASTLSVSANNGWSANVTKLFQDDVLADGYGRWDDSVGGAYAGKRFKITLLEENDTMRMIMQMLDRSMPSEIIASFDRTYLAPYGGDTRLGDPSRYVAQSWGGIVRSGPGMHHEKLGSLYEGQKITVLHRTHEIMNGYPWMAIEFGDYKQRGYQWGGIICATDYARQDLHQLCGAPESNTTKPFNIYQNNTSSYYGSPSAHDEQLSYSCHDGSHLAYELDHRASEALAIVDYEGERHYLVQVISASGSRYSNGALELHTKGFEALLTNDRSTVHCTAY
ncbi:MAG: MliC family protein [Hyphomicrobiales bacterium]